MVKGLREASWGHVATSVSLAECRASEEDWWKAWEKKLIDQLAPKIVSFFQMGSEGAFKQFAAHGYPPPEADADFLDYPTTLLEYPLEAFDL